VDISLNRQNGNALDSSGNGYHGTFHDATYTAGPELPGLPGQVGVFNDSSSRFVEMGGAAIMDFNRNSNEPFTLVTSSRAVCPPSAGEFPPPRLDFHARSTRTGCWRWRRSL